jgi:phage terminase large subunit-like protein
MTDGDVADYGVIEREVIGDCERFAPRAIGYDPWNAMPLVVRLADAMLPVQQFIQGPKSYHPAMQAFERAYSSGNLRHGGHRVLQWNAANLVARRDVNLNMAPDKKRSADRIDGVVALIMAFGMSVSHADDGGDPSGFFKNPVRA